jgi:hypothetical protein
MRYTNRYPYRFQQAQHFPNNNEKQLCLVLQLFEAFQPLGYEHLYHESAGLNR